MSKGIVVRGPLRSGYDSILTSDALQFLGELHRKFEKQRRALLAEREKRQNELDSGKLPNFLPGNDHSNIVAHLVRKELISNAPS
jgi:malate synthase